MMQGRLARPEATMGKFLSSEELRQWAERCLAQAGETTNDLERHRLRKMHEGLMEMAHTQDWLDGRLPREAVSVSGALQ